MKKKIIVMPILALVMLMSCICSCGNSKIKTENNPTPSQIGEMEITESTGEDEGRFAAEDSGATLSISLHGTIGGDAVFEVDCNEGWYQMTYNGADKTKRKLEVVSYDIGDGHLVLNAFLKGKYIGQFDGILDDSDFVYRGVFTSVSGARLDFKLSSD